MSATGRACLSQPVVTMQAFMGERIDGIPAIRAFHEISFLQLDLKPEPHHIPIKRRERVSPEKSKRAFFVLIEAK